MRWVYYYGTLLLLLTLCTVYSIEHPRAHAEVLKGILAAVPVLSAMAQALTRANLTFYLFSQRLWLKLHSGDPTLWKVGLSFSRPATQKSFSHVVTAIQAGLTVWNPKVIYTAERECRLIIDRTLHFRISMDAGEYSEDGQDHFLVQSDLLEVAYGQVEIKLDRVIHPVFRAIMLAMDVMGSSSFLNVEFVKRNPFFAFFVAHIDEKHVSNFNLIFRPTARGHSPTGKVTVTQRAMEVNAVDPEEFVRLSKQFLLLSASAAEYARS